MSQKEKDLISNIASLPPELQDKFADMAAGAAMVVDALNEQTKKEE